MNRVTSVTSVAVTVVVTEVTEVTAGVRPAPSSPAAGDSRESESSILPGDLPSASPGAASSLSEPPAYERGLRVSGEV